MLHKHYDYKLLDMKFVNSSYNTFTLRDHQIPKIAFLFVIRP